MWVGPAGAAPDSRWRSNAAAIALYLSLGYRHVGVRPNYYADEGEDAIVMVADL